MYVHRDDTIVRVALIPQLRWIQLLTLLHVCLCVTDQTREAVLHCGSGGGLAGEYFFIYSSVRVSETSILSISLYHLWYIMLSDASNRSFSRPGDRCKIRANLRYQNHETRLVSLRHRQLIMGVIKGEDASSERTADSVIRFSGV